MADRRPRSILALYWRMGGWFCLIFLAITLLLSLVSSLESQRSKALVARGVSAQAVVADKRVSRSEESTTYYVTYQFTWEGAAVSAERSVGSSDFLQAEKGALRQVWFLPESPEHVDLSLEEAGQVAEVLRWIALGFGVVALVTFWFPARWAVAAVRAARYGQVRRAVVTQVHQTSVRVNNRPLFRLKWRDDSGAEGQSLMARAHWFAGTPEGAEVVVYVGLTQAWWEKDILR